MEAEISSEAVLRTSWAAICSHGVKPGAGYVLSRRECRSERSHRQMTVYSVESRPETPVVLYQPKLSPGFSYITTRGGTQLSIYVTLPGPIERGRIRQW